MRKMTIEFEQINSLAESVKGTPEAAFFLKLSKAIRPGPSFSAGRMYEVLLGNVIEVPGDTLYRYPTDNETEYMVVPTTTRVVIHEWSWDDFDGYKRRDTIYTFNVKRGWDAQFI